MFAPSTVAAHTRIVKLATVVLLVAIALLAVGLTGSDDASAGTRCALSGRC